jgi:hypothetical protein
MPPGGRAGSQQQNSGNVDDREDQQGVKKLMGRNGAVNFSSRVEASTAALAKRRLPRSRIAPMAAAGWDHMRNSRSTNAE